MKMKNSILYFIWLGSSLPLCLPSELQILKLQFPVLVYLELVWVKATTPRYLQG